MPRCILFGVCRKALTERADNSVSLITVMTGMIATLPENEEVPENAVAPYEWGVVIVWYRMPEDGDRVFNARVEFVNPNGVIWGEALSEFAMTTDYNNIAINANMFSVANPGEYRFKLYIRERDNEGEWDFVTDFPVVVTYNRTIDTADAQGVANA